MRTASTLRTCSLASLFACSLLATVGCDDAEADAEMAALKKDVASAQASLEEAKAAVASMPNEEEVAELEEELAKAQESNAALKKKLKAAAGESGALKTELQRKEEALAAVKALEDALAATLVTEIEAGDISVKERDGYLVVNVSDKVLFASGSAELSKRGQKVIQNLADSLKALPEESVFQVGGHTDNQPIKSEDVMEKFPTNWELSAARATNVVRFLEETCEVPGERLVAAGFSEFRPVVSNKKPRNRRKNRRIEIALLPPRA